MAKVKTTAAPVYEVEAQESGYIILRNGRFLMTPAGQPYHFAQEALTQAIAEEWRAQGDKVTPTQMPLTQLACTALDIIRKDRTPTLTALKAYAQTELLCYRAEGPESLTARQQEVWQPYLKWCAARFGACFAVGCGIMPIRQPETLPALFEKVLGAYDDLALAGLSSAVDCSGSLVLGLALAGKEKTAADIFMACELDTTHQAQKWGEDPVTQARHQSMQKELAACERWFELLG